MCPLVPAGKAMQRKLKSTWKKSRVGTLLVSLAGFCLTAAANPIPVAGNSWIMNPSPGNHDSISHSNPMKWENPDSIIRTYFKTTLTGELQIAVRAKAEQGSSTIRFSFGGQSKEVVIGNAEFETVPVGTFTVKSAGYQYLEMQGIKKQKGPFARISDLIVEGSAAGKTLAFVKDEFYWGRRGPSVHLNFLPPNDAGDMLYFYNEITVPEGSDIPGSYYMANGFNGGYFGMQAKSATERWLLFSVWSPYKTNNPKDIPAEFKIKLLKKGTAVQAGEFGNEGSGGQSYRKYFWQTGITYKFLLKGEPSDNESTDFTAWFYAPEAGQWELVASFRRPKTTTYLKNPHSFLENFRTDTGHLSRMAYYSNQWIYTADQQWHEVTECRFSADATARKKARLDYAGGPDGNRFFLKNCGFFDADVNPGIRFTRGSSGHPPEIDFSKLP
jgi:hypothetical protein